MSRTSTYLKKTSWSMRSTATCYDLWGRPPRTRWNTRWPSSWPRCSPPTWRGSPARCSMPLGPKFRALECFDKTDVKNDGHLWILFPLAPGLVGSLHFLRTVRLQDLRKVVVHHMEGGGSNILSFVESRGAEALARCCHDNWQILKHAER